VFRARWTCGSPIAGDPSCLHKPVPASFRSKRPLFGAALWPLPRRSRSVCRWRSQPAHRVGHRVRARTVSQVRDVLIFSGCVQLFGLRDDSNSVRREIGQLLSDTSLRLDALLGRPGLFRFGGRRWRSGRPRIVEIAITTAITTSTKMMMMARTMASASCLPGLPIRAAYTRPWISSSLPGSRSLPILQYAIAPRSTA
jgi:hypothetical protein